LPAGFRASDLNDRWNEIDQHQEEQNMHFKLLVVMVEDRHTNDILNASREAGATGATVVNQARGEGLSPTKTFLGLSVGNQVDLILMLVEEHLSRHILEKIAKVGQFDESPGTGIAFQVDVEDAIGVRHQISALTGTVEEIL
jgi:nitrogen regulatory protein PII